MVWKEKTSNGFILKKQIWMDIWDTSIKHYWWCFSATRCDVNASYLVCAVYYAQSCHIIDEAIGLWGDKENLTWLILYIYLAQRCQRFVYVHLFHSPLNISLATSEWQKTHCMGSWNGWFQQYCWYCFKNIAH